MSYTSNTVIPLNWSWLPNAVRIGSIGDGSCLIHSILQAYVPEYIENKVDRRQLARSVRNKLADLLSENIDPSDPNSLTYYERMNNGYIKDASKEISEEFSLDNLQRLLRSTSSIPYYLNSYIADMLDKTIYILHYEKEDVYRGINYGPLTRDIIIILYLEKQEHYETVGEMINTKTGQVIKTLFTKEDNLVKSIRAKLL